MLRYSVKRLLQSLVTIFIVISVVFLLMRLMPISGYFSPGTYDKMSPEVRLNYLVKLGLFEPNGNPISPFVQLFNFYKKLFTSLDFGESTQIYVGKPVVDVISDKIPISLAFGTVSTLLSLLIGYPLGISMAKNKNGLMDTIGTGYIIIIQAVPSLVTFFLVQVYITKWMNWPLIYYADKPTSWIVPTITLSLGSIAGYALWMRRYMVDQLNSDYVKLAYAKGLNSRKVMYRHIMRNAIVPMVYGIPSAFISSLSGSLLVENLYSIPGMGGLLIKSIQQYDNNIIQTLVFMFSSMGIISIFLGDIAMTLVDPRIKLTSRGGAR